VEAERNPPNSVVIPMDYLTTTHILLSASYEKMKEILGESAAMMFFSLASDSAESGSPMLPKDIKSLQSTMLKFGYHIEESEKGDLSSFRLYCPHASKIHGYLGEKATFCPMSQAVLAVVRLEHPKSIVKKSRLEKDGSSFEIEVQD
jgi:hypothetical protein